VLLRDDITQTVWQLLELVYLDSVSRPTALTFVGLGDDDKKVVLTGFAKEQAIRSQRWSLIVQNLLSAEMGGWRYVPSGKSSKSRQSLS
jgi:hypothetical protein